MERLVEQEALLLWMPVGSWGTQWAVPRSSSCLLCARCRAPLSHGFLAGCSCCQFPGFPLSLPALLYHRTQQSEVWSCSAPIPLQRVPRTAPPVQSGYDQSGHNNCKGNN